MNRREAFTLAGLAIATTAGFKGCNAGSHAGFLPTRSQTYWEGAYPNDYIVFGTGRMPKGQWEQVGWVRRPPGSGLPRIRVWVQKR